MQRLAAIGLTGLLIAPLLNLFVRLTIVVKEAVGKPKGLVISPVDRFFVLFRKSVSFFELDANMFAYSVNRNCCIHINMTLQRAKKNSLSRAGFELISSAF